MAGEEADFSDAALRDAVRRAWGGERAPQALRDRLQSELQHRPRTDAISSARLAMAAALMLVIGIFAVVLHNSMGGSPVPPVVVAAAPAWLVSDLTRRHDFCVAGGDHHHLEGVARDDYLAIAGALRRTMHHPVLVSDLPQAGWTFRGAAVCMVGPIPSAHLVFTRGRQSVSIYSLRTDVSLDRIHQRQGGHVLAGFMEQGTLVCLVGASPDGSLKLEEIDQMTTALRPALAGAGGLPAVLARLTRR